MTLTTARVGTNNRSQIVTIPLAFRFPDNIKTVYVRKIGDDLVLSPRPDNWADFSLRHRARFSYTQPRVKSEA